MSAPTTRTSRAKTRRLGDPDTPTPHRPELSAPAQHTPPPIALTQRNSGSKTSVTKASQPHDSVSATNLQENSVASRKGRASVEPRVTPGRAATVDSHSPGDGSASLQQRDRIKAPGDDPGKRPAAPEDERRIKRRKAERHAPENVEAGSDTTLFKTDGAGIPNRSTVLPTGVSENSTDQPDSSSATHFWGSWIPSWAKLPSMPRQADGKIEYKHAQEATRVNELSNGTKIHSTFKSSVSMTAGSVADLRELSQMSHPGFAQSNRLFFGSIQESSIEHPSAKVGSRLIELPTGGDGEPASSSRSAALRNQKRAPSTAEQSLSEGNTSSEELGGEDYVGGNGGDCDN